MQTIMCSLAALTIANIFYWYRSYTQEQLQKHRVLRERVAYMLWVAAHRVAS